MNSPAPARKRLKHNERRDLLLDAATGIIAEGGIESLTMERLGEAAGVTPSLAYRFFTSRDEIVEAVFSREFDEMRVRVSRAFLKGDNFESRVRNTLDVWFDALEERGPIVASLFATNRIRTQFGELGRIVRDEDQQFWVNYLGEVYELGEDEGRTIATALFNLLESSLQAVQAGVPRATVTDTLVRFVVCGLDGLTGPSSGASRDGA